MRVAHITLALKLLPLVLLKLIPHLVLAERKLRSEVVSAVADAGMEERQRVRGDEYHGPLEDHKEDLVVGKVAAEAGLQLRDTVAAADEDGDGREADCGLEGAENEAGAEFREFRICGFAASDDVDCEGGAGAHEEEEGEDLEGETSNLGKSLRQCLFQRQMLGDQQSLP